MFNRCPFSDILKVEKHWPTESNLCKVCVAAKTMPLGPGSACAYDFISHHSCPAPRILLPHVTEIASPFPFPFPFTWLLQFSSRPPLPYHSYSYKLFLSSQLPWIVCIYKVSQEFSTRGDCAPRGHLGNLQIFLIFTAWGGEVLLTFDG